LYQSFLPRTMDDAAVGGELFGLLRARDLDGFEALLNKQIEGDANLSHENGAEETAGDAAKHEGTPRNIRALRFRGPSSGDVFGAAKDAVETTTTAKETKQRVDEALKVEADVVATADGDFDAFDDGEVPLFAELASLLVSEGPAVGADRAVEILRRVAKHGVDVDGCDRRTGGTVMHAAVRALVAFPSSVGDPGDFKCRCDVFKKIVDVAATVNHDFTLPDHRGHTSLELLDELVVDGSREVHASGLRRALWMGVLHCGPVLREGFLNKRGSFVKSWMRRYVVLRPGALTYYRDAGSAARRPLHSVGWFELSPDVLVDEDANVPGQFRCTWPDDQSVKPLRDRVFRDPSDPDNAREWREAIRLACSSGMLTKSATKGR
jgi:PH domain